MTWSAQQYILFEAERTRPVRDLLAALPERPVRDAVDLGCGPGNSTEVLAARYPGATVTGLDSSADMIAAARRRLPHLNFVEAAIEGWTAEGSFDVILANAVLQWLPDHETLLPHLARRLTPGGHLAVQMPDNLDEPSHRLMREVAADGPWAARLAGVERAPLASARRYYEWLKPHCAQVEVWRTTYHHALQGGAGAIVEWVKGTGLRPFLAPLDEIEQAAFLARYRAALESAYPICADGSVLLPFPRLFIVAAAEGE